MAKKKILDEFEKDKQRKIDLMKPSFEFMFYAFEELHSNPKTKHLAKKTSKIIDYEFEREVYQDKLFFISKYSLSIEKDSDIFFSVYLKSKESLPSFKLHKNLPLKYHPDGPSISGISRDPDFNWWGRDHDDYYSRNSKHYSVEKLIECELPFIPPYAYSNDYLKHFIYDFEDLLKKAGFTFK